MYDPKLSFYEYVRGVYALKAERTFRIVGKVEKLDLSKFKRIYFFKIIRLIKCF